MRANVIAHMIFTTTDWISACCAAPDHSPLFLVEDCHSAPGATKRGSQ
jgi:hypothetical protein